MVLVYTSQWDSKMSCTENAGATMTKKALFDYLTEKKAYAVKRISSFLDLSTLRETGYVMLP